MLRTEVTEIINRGGVWAFVGSGVSIGSGLPSWRTLVERVAERLDEQTRLQVAQDRRFQSAFGREEYPRCFSLIEQRADRAFLEKTISAEVAKIRSPGEMVRELVDWPFAGYITTNYDGLLEEALRRAGAMGWSSVGNTPNDVRKISGDVSRVVWHIHGAIALSQDRSRLVLTEKDYDDLYLEDSPAIVQLQALLAQRRVVLVGFGLRDPEVLRVLKRVGRLSNPARPLYAFIGGLIGTEHAGERKELLERYNIDVVPYKVVNDSHRPLEELLRVYGAFLIRRSLRFGQSAPSIPSYDPETTGLLVYNELCLREGTLVSVDILETLLRARVLSLLRHHGPLPISAFFGELDAKSKIIRGQATPSTKTGEEIEQVLRDLARSGLIEVVADEQAGREATLTAEGTELVNDQAATAERLAEQFVASLETRAAGILPGEAQSAARVAAAAASFLKECVARRALGVAMSLYAWQSEQQSYHITALLQALPEFMKQLKDEREAVGLTILVQAILSRPSEAEKRFLGLVLQAQFGVHLLGYDPDTLRARARDLSETLFLVDSSTLIPFLAEFSSGHSSAVLLIDRVRRMNSIVSTTALLAEEVAEHARWALGRVDPATGRPILDTLEAATGRAGERPNAFLEGFLEAVGQGVVNPDLKSYLKAVLDAPLAGSLVSNDDVETALNRKAIVPYHFDDFEGFAEELWVERDELKDRIASLRQERGTFTHERQVRAEAEALIIIRDLRDGALKVRGQSVSNAYFISHTRVIDEVAGSGLPITMRPEQALQWVATVSPCSIEEYGFLVNSLLWELSERDLTIVDKSRLQVSFSPYIVASKERLREVTEQHKAKIALRFGAEAGSAFREAADLDTPVILAGFDAQMAEELARELEEERRKREKAQAQAAVALKDRRELDQLRMEKKLRELRARSKKRPTASRSRRGKRRKR